MRMINVFTAPWYPGDELLRRAVEGAQEAVGSSVTFQVVDVEQDVARAEDDKVVVMPTAILSVDGKERRRIFGAIGLVELNGLAGVRSRARKLSTGKRGRTDGAATGEPQPSTGTD